MKTTFCLPAVASLLLLAAPGCTSLSSDEKLIASVAVSPASVHLAAKFATEGALRLLQKEKNPSRLTTVAGECQAAASAVRSMSSGTPPTVEQFQTTIRQFGGPAISPAYTSIAISLGSIYASFYPSIQANADVAKVNAYLEALASGVEAGARPYQSPAGGN